MPARSRGGLCNRYPMWTHQIRYAILFMGTMTAKLDTSAIIYLAKADLLDLIVEAWEEIFLFQVPHHAGIEEAREALPSWTI